MDPSEPEVTLATSLLHEPMSSEVQTVMADDLPAKGVCNNVDQLLTINNNIQSDNAKRCLDARWTSCLTVNSRSGHGYDGLVEEPATKKRKTTKLKVRFATPIEEKTEKESNQVPLGEKKTVDTGKKEKTRYKKPVKPAKKVTASKYVRAPQGPVDPKRSYSPKQEDEKMAGKLPRASSKYVNSGIEFESGINSEIAPPEEPGEFGKSNLLQIMNEASALEPSGELRVVKAIDLTVNLVMAVVNIEKFSYETICRWIINSKKTKYTVFNDKFGKQFDCYKVFYNLARFNSQTSNGKELLRIIRNIHYKTPVKMIEWSMIFYDEVPLMLNNISVSASIQEQSTILNLYRFSAGHDENTSLLPAELCKVEYKVHDDCDSNVIHDKTSEIENESMKTNEALMSFLGRLEATLKLDISSCLGVEDRMAKVENRLAREINLRKEGRRQESVFRKEVSKLKKSLFAAEENLKAAPGQVVERGKEKSRFVLLSSKVNILENLNRVLENHLRCQKKINDMIKRDTSFSETSKISDRSSNGYGKSQSKGKITLTPARTMPVPDKFRPDKKLDAQSERTKDRSFTRDDENRDRSLQNNAKSRKEDGIDLRAVGNLESTTSTEESTRQISIGSVSKPTIDETNSFSRSKFELSTQVCVSTQCDYSLENCIVLKIPPLPSQNDIALKKITKARKNLLKNSIHSQVDKKGNAKNTSSSASSLICFKRTLKALVKYEQMLSHKAPLPGGVNKRQPCSSLNGEALDSTSRQCSADLLSTVNDRQASLQHHTSQKSSSSKLSLVKKMKPPIRVSSRQSGIPLTKEELKRENRVLPLTKEELKRENRVLRNVVEVRTRQFEELQKKQFEAVERHEVDKLALEAGKRHEEEKLALEEWIQSRIKMEAAISSQLDSLYSKLYDCLGGDTISLPSLEFSSIGILSKITHVSQLSASLLARVKLKDDFSNNPASVELISIQTLKVKVSDIFMGVKECQYQIQSMRTSLDSLGKLVPMPVSSLDCAIVDSAPVDAKTSINDANASTSDANASTNDANASINDANASINDGNASINDGNASINDATGQSAKIPEVAVGDTVSSNFASTSSDKNCVSTADPSCHDLATKDVILLKMQEELALEKREHEATRKRLEDARLEIDKLVVVWDVLELRQDNHSVVDDSVVIPRSAVSSYDMDILEQITGFNSASDACNFNASPPLDHATTARDAEPNNAKSGLPEN